RADEERVVADSVLRARVALQPAERAVEERRPPALAERDARPERDRRHAPREPRRELFLPLAEQAHAERARPSQQLVERRLPADREPDERRVERQRDE